MHRPKLVGVLLVCEKVRLSIAIVGQKLQEVRRTHYSSFVNLDAVRDLLQF
jgi:hypothetical protein